jgi:hypothetical protein
MDLLSREVSDGCYVDKTFKHDLPLDDEITYYNSCGWIEIA